MVGPTVPRCINTALAFLIHLHACVDVGIRRDQHPTMIMGEGGIGRRKRVTPTHRGVDVYVTWRIRMGRIQDEAPCAIGDRDA